ncbi:glutamine amidotransferase-related protein [Dyadobacter luticola]|uniref:Amidotransferase n=1 Tax=Dyadobacter luticola TaxID=1979387 RepID=A0A5R9KXH3_9BACT|nr:amidotransferase [Dyadobacter luticola]TLV00840.1 amidotransferase [Dyadobacter luticola]
MKVGLLECDHVREELQYIAGDYREMFPALFSEVTSEWDFHFYDVCNGQFPESVDECDLYMCTGSRFSVYDEEDWILRLKQFVRDIYQSEKMFVGLCFGHQMLAEALGGQVLKSPGGWCVGVHRFDITHPEMWMQPHLPSLNMLMMCQDQVMTMPEDSTLLATSEHCPVAMFRVGENMLGMQAHPEFTRLYDKALMELRVERIGEEKVRLGIESLALEVHRTEAAQWIKNFAEAIKK